MISALSVCPSSAESGPKGKKDMPENAEKTETAVLRPNSLVNLSSDPKSESPSSNSINCGRAAWVHPPAAQIHREIKLAAHSSSTILETMKATTSTKGASNLV
jgi:hypothetical protein